jgi:hypothetical protein
MVTEAKFSDVVAAVRDVALDEESQPVAFDNHVISRAQKILGLEFPATEWHSQPDREKFVGQVGRALAKLASPAEGVLVKSGEGRSIRYWAPAAWEAHQAQEAEREAARAALDARKADIMRRIRLLNGEALFYVTTSGRIEMNLDTAAGLLALAERAG